MRFACREARLSEGTYAAFISHYKSEAAPEAAYIKEFLAEKTGREVFLDSDNLTEVSCAAMKEALRRSSIVVVLQTPEYLTRPYCLIELLTAIDLVKPIVALKVENAHGSYDFADAVRLLSDLEGELTRRGHLASVEALRREGVDFADASKRLSAVIPQVMSSPFNQAWGEHLRHGALNDLLAKVQAPAQFAPSLSSQLYMEK